MKTISTIEEFKVLPLGTKLYEPTAILVEYYYFAGINPKYKESIMLISSYDMNKIKGVYIGSKENHIYYLDYNEACMTNLEKAKENVKLIEDCFNSKIDIV